MAKNLKDLIKAYQDVFYIEDTSIIPLLCSVVLSNYMQGDPIWLMVIGGSSSGKTELINALSDVKTCKQLTSITPNTLLSGMRPIKGQETSLLLQWGARFTILFKDFASILSMQKDDLTQIMAQFLQLFDGELTKQTGNGAKLTWRGKANVIAASTEKIHVMEQKFAATGVRFIFFTLPLQDRIKTTKRSAQIAHKLPGLREKIREEFTEYIEHMIPTVTGTDWEIDDAISDKLIEAADFATIARSPVERDYRGKMEMVLSTEFPMRLSNQLHNLARAEMAQNGGILSEQSASNLYKVALDSIPKGRRLVLRELSKYDETRTKALALALRFETERIRMWLEELNWLGLVERAEGYGSRGDRWLLSPQARKTMEEFERVEYVGGLLDVPGNVQADEDAESVWDSF